MAIDPVALYEYARVNEAAATALESIAFPVIGAWRGVAGRTFDARLAALAKRRNELKDAHARAAGALRSFAEVADRTLQEMRFQQSQRADAVERRAHLDARSSYTTDPIELRRLQHERDLCEHDIRMADKAYARADKTFQDAEKKCTHDIEHLANLPEIVPLSERLGKLSPKDFVAYKALVTAKVLPMENLNWTADGCSDNGIVTGTVDLDACQVHDFNYRNNDTTRDPWWLDKQKADGRLAQQMVTTAPLSDFVPNPLMGGIPTVVVRSVLVFAGSELLGRPDATSTDERKQGKTKSRGK